MRRAAAQKREQKMAEKERRAHVMRVNKLTAQGLHLAAMMVNKYGVETFAFEDVSPHPGAVFDFSSPFAFEPPTLPDAPQGKPTFNVEIRKKKIDFTATPSKDAAADNLLLLSTSPPTPSTSPGNAVRGDGKKRSAKTVTWTDKPAEEREAPPKAVASVRKSQDLDEDKDGVRQMPPLQMGASDPLSTNLASMSSHDFLQLFQQQQEHIQALQKSLEEVKKERQPMQKRRKTTKCRAGDFPTTIRQQLDDRVREKLSGVMKPMKMTQKMLIPISRSDDYVYDSESTVAETQERWPCVVHGVFCLTEQKTNEDGSNAGTGDFLPKPLLLLNVGSKYMQEYVTKTDLSSIKKIVTVETEEYLGHFRSKSAKQKSIETKKRHEEKKRAAAAGTKTKHKPRATKGKNDPSWSEDEDTDEEDFRVYSDDSGNQRGCV